MRIAAGVVSIVICGLVGLFGLAIAADGASGMIAGGVTVRVVDAWRIDDEACPLAIRVAHQGDYGLYDCPEPTVQVGDTLRLHRSFFDGTYGTTDDQVSFIVMGGLLAFAMAVVVGAASWLILTEADPGTRPPQG